MLTHHVKDILVVLPEFIIGMDRCYVGLVFLDITDVLILALTEVRGVTVVPH